jgi:acyl-CoA reductase-like NAD-dependent aldehyde dehydrogenase
VNPLGYVSKSPYPLYIDGRFLPAESGRTFPILNPVTGGQFAQGLRARTARR